MARGGESRKRSVLGNAHACDEVVLAGRLGLLQPYIFAGKRSHVVTASLVSYPHGALNPRRHVTGFPGPIGASLSLHRAGRRLVGAFPYSSPSTQYVSARCRGGDFDEPGKDL